MEALEEEAEEDIRLLAGVGDEELSDGVFAIARGRFVWLAVNLCAAILAATVISQFTDTIRAFVALAVLMPIVASMGGNAGTQALTVTVRALATRSLGAANMRRFILREGLVGALQRDRVRAGDRAAERAVLPGRAARGGDRRRDDRQPDRGRASPGR